MLIASTFLLWMIVAILVIAVLALARQVGVIHERMASSTTAPVPDAGPCPGEWAPDVHAITLDGQAIVIGPGHMGPRKTLLVFVAPDCPACRKIAPLAKGVAALKDLDLVLVGHGEDSAIRSMIQRYKLGGVPFANDADIGLAFQIGTLPYGVVIRSDGMIAARGTISSRDQLESLVAADGFESSSAHGPFPSSQREVTA